MQQDKRSSGISRRRLMAGASALAAGGALGACSQTRAGWEKYDYNPVLGGALGTCFDCCLLRFPEGYRMWFSRRSKKAIAWTDSRDGIHWLAPRIALQAIPGSDWEQDVNRPIVVADTASSVFRMWYTGQTKNSSAIGYAESQDGMNWQRPLHGPVLTAQFPWEKESIMAPHVNWDEADQIYKMWYSAGGQYEPSAIGYATSKDGLHWDRPFDHAVFTPDPKLSWEKDRVTAAQVIKRNGAYYAFYIGFRDIHDAAIGLAKSVDGIDKWERLPENPIIRPGLTGWDRSSCYKPFAIFDQGSWMLWYNGRNGTVEQIGLATHDGADLGI